MEPRFEVRCQQFEKSRLHVIYRELYLDQDETQRRVLGVVLFLVLGALLAWELWQIAFISALSGMFLLGIGCSYRRWVKELTGRYSSKKRTGWTVIYRFAEDGAKGFLEGTPPEEAESYPYTRITGVFETTNLFVVQTDIGLFPLFKDRFTIGNPTDFPQFLQECMERAKQEQKDEEKEGNACGDPV